MDRVVAYTPQAQADTLFCALELSKNTWLLGVQFPDRGPLTSGDFASSAKAVKGTLERLGFQVQP